MPRQLIPGERLLVPPVHHHWILLVRRLVGPGLGVALFLFLVDQLGRGLLPGDVRLLCSSAALAGLGLWMILSWLRWAEDTLTLTDQRVILEAGVLRRTSTAIPLDRLQDVSTTQSLLGRLLNYGTVQIEAAGSASGFERFEQVAAPEQIRDLVFAATGRRARAA